MPEEISRKVANFFTAYPLRVFNKRQIILQAEDPLSSVFYIVEGRVSQYDITSTGSEIVVNTFKPGAFFPMSTALSNAPNSYFFEASTTVKAHLAPPSDAVQFLRDNPDVTLDLLTRVYRGVDGILRRMTHLMGGNAKTRLLFEILNATYRFGEPQKDNSIFIPLKEGDLARLSGLARETVNRNMQDLKAAGLLTVAHNGITISDIKSLEQLLGTTV